MKVKQLFEDVTLQWEYIIPSECVAFSLILLNLAFILGLFVR